MYATPIEDRHRADRDRRRRVPFPARELFHAERARPERDELEALEEPPAMPRETIQITRCASGGTTPSPPPGRHRARRTRRGPDRVGLARQRAEPPARSEVTASVIFASNRSRARVDTEPPAAGDDDGDEQHQPDPARVADLLGQRRCSAGRPTASMSELAAPGRGVDHLVALFHGPPEGSSHDRERAAPVRLRGPRRSVHGARGRASESPSSGTDRDGTGRRQDRFRLQIR